MKEILFGFISGIITAIGLGGGTILILLLNIFSNFDEHIIQGTNLLFFLPTAIISVIINRKLILKEGKSISFYGIIGAIFGSICSFKFDNTYLKKIFGIFLLLIAFFEIFTLIKQYRNRKNVKNKK